MDKLANAMWCFYLCFRFIQIFINYVRQFIGVSNFLIGPTTNRMLNQNYARMLNKRVRRIYTHTTNRQHQIRKALLKVKELTVIHLQLKATSRTVLSGNEAAILIYLMILGSSAYLYLKQIRHDIKDSIKRKRTSVQECMNTP